MAKVRGEITPLTTRGSRPAVTEEGREKQIIALAMDAAEQQIRDGTASSQIITYFLKKGAMQDKLEIERLKLENELIRAKTEQIQSEKDMKVLYEEAIRAMKTYAGYGSEEEDDYDED